MPTSNHTKQLLIGNFETQSYVLCTAFFCSQVSKTTVCVLRTKKWCSEPCGLNVTFSASCDWSVAIFTTSLESQESYLQITQDIFCLHSTFARLYNAAASPASHFRLAGWLAIINHSRLRFCVLFLWTDQQH